MILAATPEDIMAFGVRIQYRPTMGARGVKLVLDGMIRAMVAYDSWTPASVQMHVFVEHPRYMSRAFIRECLSYPFVQCDRELVVGVTPGDNDAALSFNRRIGFVEKYRIVDGWSPGVDLVLQEMRRGDCKWLRPYGTVRSAGASRPTSHRLEVVNG